MRPRAEDVPLRGGTANYGRVFRVGRHGAPPTRAAHRVRARGAAPSCRARLRPPRRRCSASRTHAEIVEYIPGRAATEPVPEWALTDRALESVGALLRSYHERVTGLDLSGQALAARASRTLARPDRHAQRPQPGQRDLPRRPGGRDDRLRPRRAGYGGVRSRRHRVLLGAAARSSRHRGQPARAGHRPLPDAARRLRRRRRAARRGRGGHAGGQSLDRRHHRGQRVARPSGLRPAVAAVPRGCTVAPRSGSPNTPTT